MLVRAVGAFVALFVLAAGPARAAWKPGPARYGVGKVHNAAITSPDGTTIRADVYYPTTGGKAAGGKFPVIVTQTPYGKDDASIGGTAGQLAGYSEYLVQRGYIQVISDVRGTGGSQGEFGLFDPEQGRDGAAVVKWAARFPHSNGKVGLLGESYLGIDQFATAVDAGRHSPIKAMFPIISANELYRDASFAGGFPGLEFDAAYLALTGSLNLVNPLAEGNSDLLTTLIQHTGDLGSFQAEVLADVETGGPKAYDGAYWQTRSPVSEIKKVVSYGIPAYLVGGWFDLFQRGEPLNYASFQNAYRHRPLLAPMGPRQKPTGRYQLLQGPWYHVTYGQGLRYRGLDLDGIELAWFDRWLKGRHTGIAATKRPQHLYDLGTGSWKDTARYPLEHAKPRAYYLGAGGSLGTKAPKGASGADQLVFTGSRIPCSNSAEQWAAGLGALATSYFGIQDPCAQDASLSQQGPGQQSYTTKPFARATTLAGPIGATLFATSTTPDTEWVVEVSDVGPDGKARSLTSGLLEGMQRAVIHDHRTWKGVGGRPILPYHRYTKAAARAAVPGRVTRYDVEVFPTFATLAKGHRLRITVATSDFPHALPSVTQLPGLAGGVYQLQRRKSAASSVQLPLGPVGSFSTAHG